MARLEKSRPTTSAPRCASLRLSAPKVFRRKFAFCFRRASWDRFVDLHLKQGGYDLTDLRAGNARLGPIEAAELPGVAGKRIVHLQCHFLGFRETLGKLSAPVTGIPRRA